jgi:threonine dehydratase
MQARTDMMAKIYEKEAVAVSQSVTWSVYIHPWHHNKDAMAIIPDYSRPTTPEHGTNGKTSPRTPKNTGFALTEYTANPSPPLESPRSGIHNVIPEAFLLPNGYPDYLRLILTSRVYEVVQETPLTHATNLSNRLECNVLLKREDLQPVFSFKLRGAYNKMAHLDHKERWKGVVACSAGMFGRAVV